MTEQQLKTLQRLHKELTAYMETVQIVPLEDLQAQLFDAHTEVEDAYYAHSEDWQDTTEGRREYDQLGDLEDSCGVIEKAVDGINEGLREIERTLTNLDEIIAAEEAFNRKRSNASLSLSATSTPFRMSLSVASFGC